MYDDLCKEKNIKPQRPLFENVPLIDKKSILKVLNEHEKNISDEEKDLSINKKILYQIILNLVLNACNCLIELKNYNYDFPEASEQVLSLFNTSNSIVDTDEEWIDIILNFSKCNYKIMKKLNEVIVEKFGPIEKSIVPLAIKKGKSILVSGYNYVDLEKILIATKNLDINIYTHHEMINAFQYKKLKKYSHLVSHYQRSSNNFSLDFSSFPGPIYISKNSIPKIDVIRGQIYSSAKYPAFGIAKIENDDYSSMIEYALNCEGFKQEKISDIFELGYNESEINNKIEEIIDLVEFGKIKHISFIGLFDKFSAKNLYVDNFIENIPQDYYVILFSNSYDYSNCWKVSSFYDLNLIYKILEKLIAKIDKNIISIFIPDCTSNILSHIFNLKYLEISKIFISECCPNILSPNMLQGLVKMFSLYQITNPVDDIKKLMQ